MILLCSKAMTFIHFKVFKSFFPSLIEWRTLKVLCFYPGRITGWPFLIKLISSHFGNTNLLTKTSNEQWLPIKWLFVFLLLLDSLSLSLSSLSTDTSSTSLNLNCLEIVENRDLSISQRWAWVKEGVLDCAKSISNHPALCAFIPPDHLRGLRGFRVVFTCWVLLSLHLFSALSDTSVITYHCNPLEWLASYSALREPKSLRPLIAHFSSHLQAQFWLGIAQSGLLTQPCTFAFFSPLVWPPLSPWLWLRHSPFTVRLCSGPDLPHCQR